MSNRTTFSCSKCLAGAALAIALLFFPVAHARDGERETDSVGGDVFLIAGVSAAVATATFGVADIFYGTQQRWLSPGWGIAQIVLGGGSNLFLGVYMMTAISPESSFGKGLGSLALAAGAWFIIHGALSLKLRPAGGSSERSLRLSLIPTDGGGAAMLGGRF